MMSKLDMKILNTTTISPTEQVLDVSTGGGEEQITVTCDQIWDGSTPSGIFNTHSEKGWRTPPRVIAGSAADYKNAYINIHFSKAKPIQKVTFYAVTYYNDPFTKINILTSMDSAIYNNMGNYQLYPEHGGQHDHAVDIHNISDVKFYVYDMQTQTSTSYGYQIRDAFYIYKLQFYVSDYIPYLSYESDKLFSYK